MRTALRKMGNSTGMIVPRALLGEIGVTTGAALELCVENGKLIATPVETVPRAGWSAAAKAVGDDDEADWRDFGNEGDADLVW